MKCVLLVLLVSLSVVACANDAAIHGVGGAIAPMDGHPSVRMVREKIDARINWDSVKVRCEFVFKNEGPATTVRMGFPEEASGVDVGPIKKSRLSGFRSLVDGKPVKTTFVPTKSDADSDSETYRAWHVKTVRFEANQTRTVVDEYTSPLGMDSMGGRSFSYILVTGKSWKGKIGQAVVTIDASGVTSFYRLGLPRESKGYVRKGRTVVWSAKDFEPIRDIHIDLDQCGIWIGPPSMDTPVQVDNPRLFGEQGIAMARVVDLRSIEGCTVSWDRATNECVAAYHGRSLRIRPGSRSAILDGTKVTLPAAPYIKRSRLYVPLLTVAEKLGVGVVTDDKKHLIRIW